MAAPNYPDRQYREGNEGWVKLNFMIDPEGQAFEPVVLDSTGSQSFRRAAINALRNSKFEPARLNGEAVESSMTFIYRFEITGNDRVRPSFSRMNDELARFIRDNNEVEARKLITTLVDRVTKTTAEFALLSVSRYLFAETFGGSDYEKMKYLEHALSYENSDSSVLNDQTEQSARINLLKLQIANQRFVDALLNFELLKRSGSNVEAFEPIMDRILTLPNEDSLIRVKGKTDDFGTWDIGLLKRGLYIDNLDNRLSEFRLYCSSKFQFFSFEPGVDYQIPDSWGTCRLQVAGDPNVELEVIQFLPPDSED